MSNSNFFLKRFFFPIGLNNYFIGTTGIQAPIINSLAYYNGTIVAIVTNTVQYITKDTNSKVFLGATQVSKSSVTPNTITETLSLRATIKPFSVKKMEKNHIPYSKNPFLTTCKGVNNHINTNCNQFFK